MESSSYPAMHGAAPAWSQPTIYGEGFASVYTTSRYATFSRRLARIALDQIASHVAPGRRLLDLACGAGAGTLLFAAAGFQVAAVDQSEAMIEHARLRARDEGVTLDLSCQDMRELSLRGKVDVVTCLFDALNYILEEDELARVFQRVARALDPGGLFIFDMNTAHGLATRWGTRDVISTARPDLIEINRNRYHAVRCINTTTTIIFARTEATGEFFRQYVEVHRERAYPRKTIESYLNGAGFAVLSVAALVDGYEGLSQGLVPVTPESGRLVFVARRRPWGSD